MEASRLVVTGCYRGRSGKMDGVERISYIRFFVNGVEVSIAYSLVRHGNGLPLNAKMLSLNNLQLTAFFIQVTVTDPDPEMTLLTYLRRHCQLDILLYIGAL